MATPYPIHGRRKSRKRPASLLAGVVLILLGACQDGVGFRNGVMDREGFIAVYVDLRAAALAAPGDRLTPERRDQVLSEHGVTEEDLLRFVEVHGRDVDYMARVWGEVEERLQQRDAPPDPAP